MNNNNLRYNLNQIQNDRQIYAQYSSKWISIVHFLYNNSGLIIAKIAKAGSIAKHTDTKKSDLDIIFCISPDSNPYYIYPNLVEKLNSNFGTVADIRKGDSAIHIKFNQEKIDIDLVLLSQYEFDREYQDIGDIRRLPSTLHDAIILIKFAFNRIGLINTIPGYEIEKVALNLNFYNEELSKLIEAIITELQRKFGIGNYYINNIYYCLS